MRKLAISLALASTALATPALARDDAWYVGVEGGVLLVEDIDYDIAGVSEAATVDHHMGYDFGGVLGYDFGRVRLETEVSYRSANMDAYTSLTTTPGYTGNGLTSLGAGSFDTVYGSTSALSFMVNGLVDFGDDTTSAFLGAGVGVARIDTNADVTGYGAFIDDSDTVFAWQVLAGVRRAVSDHVDVTLKYRFFNADDVNLVDVTGREFDGRFRSHSIMGGITYNFGAPEPVAPPPPPPPPPVVVTPPPPPPPPPPAPVCTPGPYIVFFEWDRSDITPEAATILNNAISNYQNCGNASVMLAGHADRSGAASYNVGLSQRRADAVKAYMAARGISEGVISTEAFGESRPRVATADGVRELQNRRVEITYGPGSGM